jgi:2-oxoglutarate dehydrogenase complex dehydrogenase (E1) component-like enzyme
VVWVQEEPRNMGAWRHVQAGFMDHFAGRPIRYLGRADAASPAVGSQKMHQQQQDRILVEAVGAARSEAATVKAATAAKH